MLGFAGIDNQGLVGLESFYDEQLRGESGHVSFFSDAQGRRLPDMADQYQPPQNGMDVKLTIDNRVQTIIERELDDAEATYDPDGAMAIAMDPSTGEILGMSSRLILTQMTIKPFLRKYTTRIVQYGHSMNRDQRLKLLHSQPHYKRMKLTWMKIIIMIQAQLRCPVTGFGAGKKADM